MEISDEAMERAIAEVKAVSEARASERENKSFTVTCNVCEGSAIFTDDGPGEVDMISVGEDSYYCRGCKMSSWSYISCKCGNYISLG